MTRTEVDAFLHLDETSSSSEQIPDPVKLMERGLCRRAIGVINKRLAISATNPEMWLLKINFFRRLGFYSSALKLVEAAISHRVNQGLLFAKAITFQDLGQHKEAIETYQLYLSGNAAPSDMSFALCNMANSLREFGDDARAESLYHQAIAADPSAATHYVNYGRLLYEQKRWPEAIAIIDKGLAQSSTVAVRIRLLEERALNFAEQNQGKPALASILEAIASGSDSIRTRYLHGRALALLGRFIEAREEMVRILSDDPANADAIRAIGMLDQV